MSEGTDVYSVETTFQNCSCLLCFQMGLLYVALTVVEIQLPLCSLELVEIQLPLPLSAEIKGVGHRRQLSNLLL